MLVLKRVESKQDKERLRTYLGDNLFNQYMDVRKKLPNLSNQFKDFSKIDLNTDNNKKELLNSYNRLVDKLPKDLKSKYKKLNVDVTNSIKNHKDIVIVGLLEHGANPNVKNNYGDTPLHYASERGSKYIVELLLKHGAEPKYQEYA